MTPGASQTATTYGYEIDSDLSSLTHNYPGATLDLAFTHTTSAAGQLLSTITSEPLNRYTPGTTLGTQTYASANPLNQYPSVTPIGGGTTTLTYDLNGNLTGDGSSTYTYDATNRLLSIAGLVTASYGYDALDRRMQKTAAATTTRYLHAGSDEIAEYTSAGALLRRYVPAPGTDERAAMIDSGLASPPATSIKYAHTDRQGSVMAVTDSTGAVTERFAYDGFGRSSSALSGYPFRYTGQRLDFESGLMFYKARVYSTSLGRFLQTDPIGTKDDLNLYAYVGNDPINKTDPSGKWHAEYSDDGSSCGYVWVPDMTPYEFPKQLVDDNSSLRDLPVTSSIITSLEGGLNRNAGQIFAGTAMLGIDLFAGGKGRASWEAADTTVALMDHAFAAEVRFAAEGLTRRQSYRAAVNPALTPMFKGERMDYFFRQEVKKDARLMNRVDLTPRGKMGPDVVWKRGDRWWDLTTEGEWAAHTSRYEDFGRGTPLFYQ